MRYSCLCLALAVLTGLGFSQTLVSGSVSGTWTLRGSPYIATSDISISGTLRIEPGVRVQFQAGGLRISIGGGKLIAKGSPNATIVFEPKQGDLPGIWEGIDCVNNIDADTLEYCEVRYARVGVNVRTQANWTTPPVIMQHCDIHHSSTDGAISQAYSGTATAAVSQLFMYDCSIHDNAGNGFSMSREVWPGASGHPEASLVRCKIYRNGRAGIRQPSNTNTFLNAYNNTIVGNAADGIATFGYTKMINNIIAWNGGFGVNKQDANAELGPKDVLYNLIWKNGAGAYNNLSSATFGRAVTVNANGDSCDSSFNIYIDPMFSDQDTANHRFALAHGSPCVNAGTNIVGGNIIYDPDGTLPDMGAEYRDRSTGINDDAPQPEAFELNQNYPNPFNPSTTIEYHLPRATGVRLTVYTLTGQEVAVLVNEHQTAGNYKVAFNASTLPSGIYFYSLRASAFSSTKKMALLK